MKLSTPLATVWTPLVVALLFAAVSTAPHFKSENNQKQIRVIVPETDVSAASPSQSLVVAVAGPNRRTKRAFGDFFGKLWTMASLGKAQYDDTRTTLAKIYEILRDQFSDTMIKKSPEVSVGISVNGTTETPETTTERYRISRKELGRILRRNFRGLKRLAEIERREAQNATKYNIQEYKVQLANSLQSFVYNLPSN